MRVGVLVVALVLTGGVAAGAAGGNGKPEEARGAKEAKRLFDAAPVTTLVAERTVSVDEVAAFAAEKEGLDPGAARARVTGASADAAGTLETSAVYCNWAEWQHGRGIFPYRRWIVGQTYWCYYYGGAITYRASNTAARVDGVCSGSNARDWRVSGGAGYSWVVVHHEADFSCVTPWWFPLNDSLWMEPAFNSYGSTSMTRTN